MRFQRSAGTLVHPTSFPGTYGIGDFGHEARQFLDVLHETNQTIWQVLPLTPTGYGFSPYASYSAFAGNAYLISIDRLVEQGLLTREEAQSAVLPSHATVDYEAAFSNKDRLFPLAAERFYANKSEEEEKAFKSFKRTNKHWLDDYVLFMAVGQSYNMQPWNTWHEDIARRKPEALKAWKKDHKDEIRLQYWKQYEFSKQWNALKSYANERNIRVVGDIPIFVDHNSADVWANPRFFEVDAKGNRKLVAGVPPDYFSETGQLWGNPLYKWKELEKENFSWWVNRFKQMFEMYDAIRVDHFRGFDAYWEVKATEQTAVKGRWVKGPGATFFDSILEQCGELPIIAEDLGFITKGVEELRDRYDFPGMKIIQFAFDSDAQNVFLPHNYPQNSVTYSGTHDNDTARGWYDTAPGVEQHRARVYAQSDGNQIHWDFIRMGMFSVADQAIFPLQDYLGLDGTHRMNTPGTVQNNWLWRYTPDMLENLDKGRITEYIEWSNRKVEK
ncbi:MAG: 4-alpha-glucanotransferase [Bacteroidota bacterium]